MEMTTTDSTSATDQLNLVTFRLDRWTCALPIEPIVQIFEMVAITPIPQANHSIEGVINVRGAVVPVVNMRHLMGLPRVSLRLHTPIVLVRIGEQQMVGLIVDEVLDVLDLSLKQITRPEEILPEGLGDAPLVQGLARVQDSTVLLLDLGRLFLPDRTHALAEVVAAFESATKAKPEPAPDLDHNADSATEVAA